jgi:GNAT superfamily N-acetyltransferase
LGFNDDRDVQRHFGPLLEPILVLRDPKTGELVGAANFSLYAYPEEKAEFSFDASCQLHFLLVRDDLRGLGIAPQLLDLVEAAVATFGTRHCAGHRSFITCEQNNPLKMTADQVIADARTALIDPYDRTSWWGRRGFRRLDLPYVQPPLSADSEACTYLDYYVRISGSTNNDASSIPSSVLLEHLRRFFTVSVGKFAFDMDQEPNWRNVAAFISGRPHITISQG